MADSVDEDPLPRLSPTISYFLYNPKAFKPQNASVANRTSQSEDSTNVQCVTSSLRNGARTCAYQLFLTAQVLDW